jgi:hypothetical protein
MSRTTPRSFYDLFVIPNFNEYLEAPSDIRRGFNASLSAFQLADIMYAFYRRNDPNKLAPWPTKKDFLVALGKRQPLFVTIQSVATAYKHLYTNGAHYEVESPGPMRISVPAKNTELESTYDTKGDVIVRRRDGSEISLTVALRAVVEALWPEVLPEEDS